MNFNQPSANQYRQRQTASVTRCAPRKLQRLALAACASLALCALITGCSKDDLNRQVVHGRVTYDGQNVTGGDILFVPVGDTVGPITGAAINNGEYRADHGGGVPLGKHQIRIRGFLGEMPTTPQGGPDNVKHPAVPAEFYTASKLELELTPGTAELEQHFDLQPQGRPPR